MFIKDDVIKVNSAVRFPNGDTLDENSLYKVMIPAEVDKAAILLKMNKKGTATLTQNNIKNFSSLRREEAKKFLEKGIIERG